MSTGIHWGDKYKIDFITFSAKNKQCTILYKASLNPGFPRNYINHRKSLFHLYVSGMPETKISSNRCAFSMYLPFYWKVSKLAFASIMLSSWQFLSTAILSTRQAALITSDLSKKEDLDCPCSPRFSTS